MLNQVFILHRLNSVFLPCILFDVPITGTLYPSLPGLHFDVSLSNICYTKRTEKIYITDIAIQKVPYIRYKNFSEKQNMIMRQLARDVLSCLSLYK